MARHTHCEDTRPIPAGFARVTLNNIMERVQAHSLRSKIEAIRLGRTIGQVPLGECFKAFTDEFPDLQIAETWNPSISYIDSETRRSDLLVCTTAHDVCRALGDRSLTAGSVLEASVRKFQVVQGRKPGTTEFRATINDIQDWDYYILAEEITSARQLLGIPEITGDSSPTNGRTYDVVIGTAVDAPPLRNLKSVCGAVNSEMNGSPILLGAVEPLTS